MPLVAVVVAKQFPHSQLNFTDVLRMDSAGKITIQGSEFKFEASGAVQITGKDIDLN
ncbi:hypothetical protein [Xenorhabdus sp. SGI240]|uniref:hypothetical protein n=1 Tax=Xenorhabdus sp. SGI240 TaxID=3158262 RepID=UPI0032B84822